jgi:1,4-dihydroxy-2-naphthoate octaprenyltransferase
VSLSIIIFCLIWLLYVLITVTTTKQANTAQKEMQPAPQVCFIVESVRKINAFVVVFW